MHVLSAKVASITVVGAILIGCGGGNPEPQQPLALAAAPDAEVPYDRACGVESLSVKPPAAHSATDSSMTLEGRVDAACAEVWLVAHRVGTMEYVVQTKGTVKSSGDWIAQARFDTTSIGRDKIFEILAVANPTVALEADAKLPGWPKGDARSEIVVVNREPVPEPPPCPNAAAAPSEE